MGIKWLFSSQAWRSHAKTCLERTPLPSLSHTLNCILDKKSPSMIPQNILVSPELEMWLGYTSSTNLVLSPHEVSLHKGWTDNHRETYLHDRTKGEGMTSTGILNLLSFYPKVSVCQVWPWLHGRKQPGISTGKCVVRIMEFWFLTNKHA